MRAPKPLAAGNWKMNGLKASGAEIADLAARLKAAPAGCDVLICPPFTLVASLAEAVAGSGVAIGAQDCHAKASGAHTGDVSAPMLADAGASFVIVGHSERRADHGETDAIVAAKATAVQAAGLSVIICVGETEAERVAGREADVVSRQLAGSIPADIETDRLVIAYEPVWAIGTGRTPSAADVEAIHGVIREKLVARFGAEAGSTVRILYGGSVKPDNAKELMSVANVNGALVGGASLKAADFDAIIGAWR